MLAAAVLGAWLVGLAGLATTAYGPPGAGTSPHRLAPRAALSDSEAAVLVAPSDGGIERIGQQSSKRAPLMLLAVVAVTLALVTFQPGPRRRRGHPGASPWRRQLVALRAPPALRPA